MISEEPMDLDLMKSNYIIEVNAGNRTPYMEKMQAFQVSEGRSICIKNTE